MLWLLGVQTLVKQYTVSPDLLDEKAPSLSDTSCSEINWKAGKNLTVLETVKKQKAKSGKNKGQVRSYLRLCSEGLELPAMSFTLRTCYLQPLPMVAVVA